jgi:hypothetical protein
MSYNLYVTDLTEGYCLGNYDCPMCAALAASYLDHSLFEIRNSDQPEKVIKGIKKFTYYDEEEEPRSYISWRLFPSMRWAGPKTKNWEGHL